MDSYLHEIDGSFERTITIENTWIFQHGDFLISSTRDLERNGTT
jgi:hypothetical protein